MGERVDLQRLLETICTHVYYQAPSNINIQYPAILYTRRTIDIKHASNKGYVLNKSYTVTVIDRDPDSIIVDKVSLLPGCSHDRHYVSDGLNHDIFTIYY